jgi:hypothetical protein
LEITKETWINVKDSAREGNQNDCANGVKKAGVHRKGGRRAVRHARFVEDVAQVLRLADGYSVRGAVTGDVHAQYVGEVAKVFGFEPIAKGGHELGNLDGVVTRQRGRSSRQTPITAKTP